MTMNIDNFIHSVKDNMAMNGCHDEFAVNLAIF